MPAVWGKSHCLHAGLDDKYNLYVTKGRTASIFQLTEYGMLDLALGIPFYKLRRLANMSCDQNDDFTY